MRFAFDIDGTISAAPDQFVAIMRALHDAHHEVHVLTGTMDPEVTAGHYERRWRQLAGWGIHDGIARLAIVTNPPITAKADYCREHSIDMLFEDSAEWSAPCAEVCPVLLVHSVPAGR